MKKQEPYTFERIEGVCRLMKIKCKRESGALILGERHTYPILAFELATLSESALKDILTIWVD